MKSTFIPPWICKLLQWQRYANKWFEVFSWYSWHLSCRNATRVFRWWSSWRHQQRAKDQRCRHKCRCRRLDFETARFSIWCFLIFRHVFGSISINDNVNGMIANQININVNNFNAPGPVNAQVQNANIPAAAAWKLLWMLCITMIRNRIYGIR